MAMSATAMTKSITVRPLRTTLALLFIADSRLIGVLLVSWVVIPACARRAG
jgi:hypothetical protein